MGQDFKTVVLQSALKTPVAPTEDALVILLAQSRQLSVPNPIYQHLYRQYN